MRVAPLLSVLDAKSCYFKCSADFCQMINKGNVFSTKKFPWNTPVIRNAFLSIITRIDNWISIKREHFPSASSGLTVPHWQYEGNNYTRLNFGSLVRPDSNLLMNSAYIDCGTGGSSRYSILIDFETWIILLIINDSNERGGSLEPNVFIRNGIEWIFPAEIA